MRPSIVAILLVCVIQTEKSPACIEMRSLERDRAIGRAGEYNVIDVLKTLDPSIILHNRMFDRLDFIGEKVRIEHKTRTNAYNDYPTTLMPCDKAIVDEKPLYFTFGFTDGVYMIEYTPDSFADIEVKPFCRRPRYGIIDKPKPYFHIPIDRLVKLA